MQSLDRASTSEAQNRGSGLTDLVSMIVVVMLKKEMMNIAVA